ncbi:MAG TPA: DUF2336 domain-containing protein [Alphaproteobacteria bacterium]|nr:DUF2336 domain-containing protein [Alphaproteobacteria bacterium]
MASALSQADVARLLADPSVDVRAEVASKLAAEIDSPALTESELQIAHDIVRLMARDVATAVRAALSHCLRSARRLPHDVALKLAHDVDSVALPILSDSSVLTDADLIAVIRNGSELKHEAIAVRRDVSEALSDALIAGAGEAAVTALMRNETARISDQGLDKAIDRFGKSETVTEAMVMRQYLPATVAERLVALVSDQLASYLVIHHQLSPSLATDLIMQSRERAIMQLRDDSADIDLGGLVRELHHNHRLTPTLVIRSVCMGDVDFFTTALAVLADVPVSNARILVEDAGGKGLSSLWSEARMPDRLLSAARVALRVIASTRLDGGDHDLERYRGRVIGRIVTQFEDFDGDDLDYLLDKLGDIIAVTGTPEHRKTASVVRLV